MKWQRWMCASLFVLVALQGVAGAQEGRRPFQFVNRLRLEFDDNVRQTEENADSSLKVIEELEFQVNLNLEQTFVSVRYMPSLVWWDDREEDESDVHHDFDFLLSHALGPRVNMALQDTFRLAELPELMQEVNDQVIRIREENDYIYNALNGSLGIMAMPALRTDLAARYIVLRYDEDAVAAREDYDQYVVGGSVGYLVVPEATVAGDLRYESIDYDSEVDRGSSGVQIGGALDYIFTPNLLGNARAGYQNREYNDAFVGDETAPYAEGTLTFLPSPATRVTAGLGFSLYESDVFPFSGQERTKLFANLAHDLTAKVSFYLSGVVTKGDYQGEDLPEGAAIGDLPPKIRADVPEEMLTVPLSQEYIDSISDFSEDILQISARLTYKVNRSNWLETGLQYSKLDSDLRENFERNRIHVGWKTQF